LTKYFATYVLSSVWDEEEGRKRGRNGRRRKNFIRNVKKRRGG